MRQKSAKVDSSSANQEIFPSFSAVMEAVPSIVCETLYSLGLHDQVPSWKIMDNKGRITVVLHWEPDEIAALRGTNLPAIAGPSRQSSTCSTIASGGPRLLGIHTRSISQVNESKCVAIFANWQYCQFEIVLGFEEKMGTAGNTETLGLICKFGGNFFLEFPTWANRGHGWHWPMEPWSS